MDVDSGPVCLCVSVSVCMGGCVEQIRYVFMQGVPSAPRRRCTLCACVVSPTPLPARRYLAQLRRRLHWMSPSWLARRHGRPMRGTRRPHSHMVVAPSLAIHYFGFDDFHIHVQRDLLSLSCAEASTRGLSFFMDKGTAETSQ
jgi:hypothetical protein